MEEANTIYVLEKGTDKVIVTGKKVSTDYSMNIEDLDQTFLVTLPAFNISFYIEDEKDISEQASNSLGSFLRYWLVKKGKSKFFEHMLELGFEIKAKKARKVIRKKNSKIIRHISEQYNLQ